MKICLIKDEGEIYNTIHYDGDYLESIYKRFGDKVGDYFKKNRFKEIPSIKTKSLCYLVGEWKYEKYDTTYCMVTNGKIYNIFANPGLLIENKNNYIEFFKFIFEEKR